MPIPVASDPVISPPRPDPGRPAARQAAAPFEELLDAVTPAAETQAPEPKRETRRRDKPSHADAERQARSERPSGADGKPARIKDRDKPAAPRDQDRSESAMGAVGSAADSAADAATQNEDGTAVAPADGLSTAPRPSGEEIGAILNESADGTDGAPAHDETGDVVAALPLPVTPPQPETAPVPTAIVAAPVNAPVDSAPETEIPAADAAAGSVDPAAAALARAAAKEAGRANATPGEADTLDGEAALAASGEVATEARPDKPVNSPDRATVRERAVSSGPMAAAPESTDNASRPAGAPTAGATPHPHAGAKEPLLQPGATQPRDHDLASAPKLDAPASQTGATPHIPLPAMGPAALRVTTSPDVAVPVSGLAVEIAARVQNGQKSFEIRLDPPELGRVDVRLDVDRSGNVTTRLTVERVETLDLLRRDSQNLERALQQAGLKTDGGLEFSLRDQSLAHRDHQQRDHASAQSRIIIPDEEPAAAEAARRNYGRLLGFGGGVDIRV